MTSVHALEADVAATRDRLNDTIGLIQDKLTVSGMVDEIMGQAGVPKMEDGHEFVLGLLRRHPLPVMLAAAGIGFLIYRMSKADEAFATKRLGRGEVVELPVLATGQGRVYDPDVPSRHLLSDAPEMRRAES